MASSESSEIQNSLIADGPSTKFIKSTTRELGKICAFFKAIVNTSKSSLREWMDCEEPIKTLEVHGIEKMDSVAGHFADYISKIEDSNESGLIFRICCDNGQLNLIVQPVLVGLLNIGMEHRNVLCDLDEISIILDCVLAGIIMSVESFQKSINDGQKEEEAVPDPPELLDIPIELDWDKVLYNCTMQAGMKRFVSTPNLTIEESTKSEVKVNPVIACCEGEDELTKDTEGDSEELQENPQSSHPRLTPVDTDENQNAMMEIVSKHEKPRQDEVESVWFDDDPEFRYNRTDEDAVLGIYYNSRASDNQNEMEPYSYEPKDGVDVSVLDEYARVMLDMIWTANEKLEIIKAIIASCLFPSSLGMKSVLVEQEIDTLTRGSNPTEAHANKIYKLERKIYKLQRLAEECKESVGKLKRLFCAEFKACLTLWKHCQPTQVNSLQSTKL